jgi:outer membrane lipoprotein-sorting protein
MIKYSIGVIVAILFAVPAFCQTQSPEKVFALMKKGFDNITDYQCIFTSYSSNGAEERIVTYEYFFKKPKLVRMKVLDGKYAGAILLYNEKKMPDKVRLKSGGMIAVAQALGYPEALPLNDKWMTDLRGYTIAESDWGWYADIHLRFFQEMRTDLDLKHQGEEAINSRPAWMFALSSNVPEKTKSISRETIWIDKETYFPVKFIQYDRGGKILLSSSFKNIKFNNNLKDTIFSEF